MKSVCSYYYQRLSQCCRSYLEFQLHLQSISLLLLQSFLVQFIFCLIFFCLWPCFLFSKALIILAGKKVLPFWMHWSDLKLNNSLVIKFWRQMFRIGGTRLSSCCKRVKTYFNDSVPTTCLPFQKQLQTARESMGQATFSRATLRPFILCAH